MIRIHLPFPVSVNAAYANGGKRGRRKTREYLAWYALASVAVKDSHRQNIGPYNLSIYLKRPDNRRRDLGNLEKVVSDFLVSHGIVKDDYLCRRLDMTWADDIPAPCVVTIEPVDNWIPVGQAASAVLDGLKRTDFDNALRDAFDDFLDAVAEAEKTGDPDHTVIAGRLYARFMKLRDARR